MENRGEASRDSPGDVDAGQIHLLSIGGLEEEPSSIPAGIQIHLLRQSLLCSVCLSHGIGT